MNGMDLMRDTDCVFISYAAYSCVKHETKPASGTGGKHSIAAMILAQKQRVYHGTSHTDKDGDCTAKCPAQEAMYIL